MFPSTARVFIGYFQVSWHKTVKLFPLLFLTIYCYWPILANVGRYFDFILDLLMHLCFPVCCIKPFPDIMTPRDSGINREDFASAMSDRNAWNKIIVRSIPTEMTEWWWGWFNLPRTSHQAFSFTPVPTFGIFCLLKIKPFSSFRQNIKNSMIDGYNTVINS